MAEQDKELVAEQQGEQTPETPKRRRSHRAVWVLAVVVALIVALPAVLYIPQVQNVVARWACAKASETLGMDVSLRRILIEWPLDVSIDGLSVVKHDGDTLVVADNLTARLAVKPLLHLNVVTDSVWLTSARVHFVAEDTSLDVRADVDYVGLNTGAVNLRANSIDIDDATLNGGRVTLAYYSDRVEPDSIDEPSEPWHITARHLSLNDVDYTMTMMPTIDNLTAHVSNLSVSDGVVDTGERRVSVAAASGDSVAVNYIYPTLWEAERYAALHQVSSTETTSTDDESAWRVEVGSVRVTRSAATYAVNGSVPATGLDTDHIVLTDVNIAVDSLYNEGLTTRLHVSEITANERSGLSVKGATGDIAVDTTGVTLGGVHLATLLSEINLDGHVDMAMLEGAPGGQMSLTTSSQIALQEVARALPGLKPMLDGVPQYRPLAVSGTVTGNMDKLHLEGVRADMPRYITATVGGTILNPTDPSRMAGDIDFDATLANIDFVKPLVLDKNMASEVNLPPMRVKGKASLHGTDVSADAAMTLRTGEAVGRASFDTSRESYDIDMTLKNFPVKAVLPLYGIGDVTARVRAHGRGFDFANPATDAVARIDLVKAQYNGVEYENLTFDGSLGAGAFKGNLVTVNDYCAVDLNVDGVLDGTRCKMDATGRVTNVDLKQMGFADFACNGSGLIDLHCNIDAAAKTGTADIALTGMRCRVADDTFVADSASFSFDATDSAVTARFDNEDNHVTLTAACGVDTLLARLQATGNVAMSQLERRALNIDTLQAALPPFTLSATMGRDGLLQRYVAGYDIDFRNASLEASNDTLFRLEGRVNSVSIGATAIDTLTLRAGQWENKYLAFKAHMGNRRGTMDEFARVDLEGGILGSTIDFLVTQQNIDRQVGYRLGCHATLTDSAVVARLFPQEMTIGYRKWQINNDNYANYDYHTRMIDADIDLRSDLSALKLLTMRAPGATSEDIHIDVENLQLSEWTRFLSSFSPMTGRLDIDSDLRFDGSNLEGTGRMSLKDFTYNNRRVGDIGLNTTYTIDPNSVTTDIEADMTVDGEHVALLSGALNDADVSSPLNLNLSLSRFPLRRASAFIPMKMVSMRGYLTGTLSLTGTLDNPLVNGRLAADSACVRAPLYSVELRLSDKKLFIKDNVIAFDHYKLYGSNDEPLDINGVVNLRDLTSPVVTLDLTGSNVRVVDGEQRDFSELFGKAFVDATARVRTVGHRLDINADLALLHSTNVTYVMQDEVNSTDTDFDEDMVTFVNLSDTTDVFTPVLKTAAESLSYTVLANMEVRDGAKLNVFLSSDGNDYANVTGGGRFKYRMDFAGKNDFTGTYTVESGMVRYTPPLISQKNFTIAQGSSITWTGELLNPTLDLSATDRVKTSVSGDNGSTVVNFDVTAVLGGNLNGIKLSFDMSADDMSVQNDLQSMSSEQRSQTAINMLLYNTYSGNDASNNINNLTAGSALFSFVNSQINGWANKIVKGVDLQLGINQYEGQNKSGVQTSYSYRLSKSLFNDRFKIIVGGEYSTDATSSESIANNLLSEVSLEYLLTDSGNMLVRLFRHTDFESVLEGQVSRMGVGFVLKHKLARIDDLFRRRKSVKTQPVDTVQPQYFTVPLDTLPVDSIGVNAEPLDR